MEFRSRSFPNVHIIFIRLNPITLIINITFLTQNIAKLKQNNFFSEVKWLYTPSANFSALIHKKNSKLIYVYLNCSSNTQEPKKTYLLFHENILRQENVLRGRCPHSGVRVMPQIAFSRRQLFFVFGLGSRQNERRRPVRL